MRKSVKNGTKQKQITMGLDSLVNEQGHVHSEREAEDVIFDREAWKETIHYYPEAVYILASRDKNDDKERVKFFIELIDDILGGDVHMEGNLSQDEKESIEYTRDNLVELLEMMRSWD